MEHSLLKPLFNNMHNIFNNHNYFHHRDYYNYITIFINFQSF